MSATVLDYLFVFIMYGQIRIAMNTICVQWHRGHIYMLYAAELNYTDMAITKII